jgi:hypothetical protein
MTQRRQQARAVKVMLGRPGIVTRVAALAIVGKSEKDPGAWFVGSLVDRI